MSNEQTNTPQNSDSSPELSAPPGSAFRWCYAAVCALAIKLLDEDNKTCGDNWPVGQSWEDLGDSSRAIYMRRARELAGIPHEDFLRIVRAGAPDVEDIYEAGRIPQNNVYPTNGK